MLKSQSHKADGEVGMEKKELTKEFLEYVNYYHKHDGGGMFWYNWTEPAHKSGRYRNAADVLYRRICKAIPTKNRSIRLHPLDGANKIIQYIYLSYERDVYATRVQQLDLNLLLKTGYDPIKAAKLRHQLNLVFGSYTPEEVPNGLLSQKKLFDLILNVYTIPFADESNDPLYDELLYSYDENNSSYKKYSMLDFEDPNLKLPS
ncbi:MAG: hypothetical protein IPP42_17555 [Saprospiraceae bacterium]|nr:hypothetical protein [Saprospiraceae bacterium]